MKNGTKEPTIQPKSESFFSFLKQKENKRELLGIIACYILIYIVMRMTYGLPASTSDSGTYLLSAETGVISGYRPIGYSWMISFFHKIFGTFVGLFTGQYLFHAITQILFLYTIKYFFEVEKKLFYILSICFIFSPGLLYCTNYVMSDGVFTSFTLLYLLTSLWLIKKPTVLMMIAHFITLYLVFNIRYAALFYPGLTTIIFLLHAKKNKMFIPMVFIPIFLVLIIYKNVQEESKRVFGINEFSAFGGWALANNAMAIVPHVDLKLEKFEDPNLQIINQLVMAVPEHAFADVSIFRANFIWDKELPGKRMLGYNMQTKGLGYINSWIYTGGQLREYGKELIKRYPLLFAQHFLFGNLKRFFYYYEIPDKVNFEVNDQTRRYYNTDIEEVVLKAPFLHKFSGIGRIFNIILWVCFFLSIGILLVMKDSRPKDQIWMLQFLVVFFGIYLFFSVVAHPVMNFRYLLPLYGIQLALPIIVASNLLKSRTEAAVENPETVTAA